MFYIYVLCIWNLKKVQTEKARSVVYCWRGAHQAFILACERHLPSALSSNNLSLSAKAARRNLMKMHGFVLDLFSCSLWTCVRVSSGWKESCSSWKDQHQYEPTLTRKTAACQLNPIKNKIKSEQNTCNIRSQQKPESSLRINDVNDVGLDKVKRQQW